MQDTTESTGGLGKKLASATEMLVGIIVMPIAFIVAPRFVINSFKPETYATFSNPDHRDQLRFETVKTTPAIDRLTEVGQMVRDLIDDQDWVMLSDLLEEWDQSRAAALDGTRLARAALHLAAIELSQGMAGGNMCHPGDVPFISAEMLDHMEGVAALHPKCYPLAALCAYLQVCRGWTHRGQDYAYSVSEEGWAGMGKSFERALWLLEPHDAEKCNSPLLASVRFELLAFMPDGHNHVHDFYRNWSKLDRKDHTPHAEYGFMMLPRWFGSYTLLEEAAQKAYAATHNITGAAAYAAVYVRALEYDVELLLYMDPDLFTKGIDDLVTHAGADPVLVASIAQELHMSSEIPLLSGLGKEQKKRIKEVGESLRTFSYHLARTRLSAIHPPSWDEGIDEALDFISEGIQSEIMAGHRFVMGQNGVEMQPETV